MILFIPFLFALCFAGLFWALSRSFADASDHYSRHYATETSRELESLFLFIPPHRIVYLARIAAGIIFLIAFITIGDVQTLPGFLQGTVLGLMAGAAMLFAPAALVGVLKKRRLLKFNLQLVDALVGMSNALRAGFSINQAFEAVVKEGQNPIAQEFSVFLQQLRIGVRFEDAIKNLEERVGSEDLTLMVRSIEIARQTGGNLTEVFERIADTIRERTRIEGRIRALTAMGRLQGIVVGLIPIFLLFVMTAIDPQMMMNFYASPTGVAMLCAVVVMEILGFIVIRKIININV